MVATARNTDSTPRGAAIDVFFNFGDGCYWKYQQHQLGGLPLMSSSTSVVAAAGNTDSTPQGACHRCLLQLRWWLLAEILTAPPGGPTINVFINFGGGYYRQY
jgi:hypothetical protein